MDEAADRQAVAVESAADSIRRIVDVFTDAAPGGY